MREHGPQMLREPHVKHLQGRLWEIRASGRDGIARAVYVTVRGRRVVVVLVFVKKSQRTPQRYLDLAVQRMKEIEE
jgi:phage-related protein